MRLMITTINGIWAIQCKIVGNGYESIKWYHLDSVVKEFSKPESERKLGIWPDQKFIPA